MAKSGTHSEEWAPRLQIQPPAGPGFLTLLWVIGGVNYLVEVKDGSLPPSARKLTGPQVDFHNDWRGQICVVKNLDEAVALLKEVSQ